MRTTLDIDVELIEEAVRLSGKRTKAAEYFNRSETERANAVETLIRDDRAALTGVILAVLLQGTRTAEEFSELHRRWRR